jgi:LuxR family maltose regulon positive regulatory protein
METEVWNNTSEKLRGFLVRLSLIDHLSVELIMLLAAADPSLVDELEKQNAYVRRDNYINAFMIHPLFLEFLAAKQELLSPEQKNNTYTIAGDWCNRNGFKIDALSYYEKIGDYKAIVYMFIGSSPQIPYDISCYAAAILDRTPLHFFDTVTYLASTHLRTIICQGKLEEAHEKAAFYEARYISLQYDDPFRRSTLSSIYYCWATVRRMTCVSADVYDFDLYFEKLSNCYTKAIDPGNLIIRAPGPWISTVGSSK